MKKKHKFSRRDFLRLTSMTALPITLGAYPVFSQSLSKVSVNSQNDKVLVLVQLQGGNDGLNTLFDANQYSNLNAVRSNIIVPETSLLSLGGSMRFHPSMGGMQGVWNDENLGIVQSVGYPNQNRSHFRSSDIWHSASAAADYVSTGWIGRFYDLNYSTYPNGFPNSNKPHPFALTIGSIVSETCQGINSNYSLALIDPFNPGNAFASDIGDIPKDCYGDALNFINETAEQTNAYSSVISQAANDGNNVSANYTASSLSTKLKHVARLISGGLQTKIYVVQLGGFDTHDNQVVDGQTNTGDHSELLQELSDAIAAFQDDLNLLGVAHRVAGMTYSEFGRRIRSNGGLGTDHGTAAPLFLFGNCVKKQILGNSPIIDTQVGIEDGLPMQFDFRDVYGSVLKDWLGANETEVKSILYPDFQALPILDTSCANNNGGFTDSGGGKDNTGFDHFYDPNPLDVYPNPARDIIEIRYKATVAEIAELSILGTNNQQRYGAPISVQIGSNSLSLSIANLRLQPGAYFVRLTGSDFVHTKGIVVVR